MQKSILIIDTPDGCRKCSLCKRMGMSYDYFCSAVGTYVSTLGKPEKHMRPRQCPLIEVKGGFELNEYLKYLELRGNDTGKRYIPGSTRNIQSDVTEAVQKDGIVGNGRGKYRPQNQHRTE